MNFDEALEVINKAVLAHNGKPLDDVQIFVLRGTWEGKNYEEMSKFSRKSNMPNYKDSYLRRDVGYKLWKLLSNSLGEKVRQANFRTVIERRQAGSRSGQSLQPNKLSIEETTSAPPNFVGSQQTNIAHQRQDLREAPDASVFYGRTEELSQMQQWIVNDRCRIIALLGMGGIGKTALSAKLVQQIQDEFEYIIWRSLRNAPPLKDLLADLIKFLSNQQETNLPESVNSRVSRLLDYLCDHKCLLVLDNAEVILCSGERSGYCLKEYEGFEELLRRVGEERHQSCLLLTSREKPKEIALLDGKKVISLQVSGLKEAEVRQILSTKGSFIGTENEFKELNQHYAGNPKALEIVASIIQDLFEGVISEFLKRGMPIFRGISDLLEQQLERLSDLEKTIIYWLAIEREPVAISDLAEDILYPVSEAKLQESMQSLRWRSLIDKSTERFTLPPVIMDYITEQLIEQICEEIRTGQILLLNSHTLIKAQAKDYIRDTQVRLIANPLIDRLQTVFKGKISIEERLNQILSILREKSPREPGYAGGNVLNLLCQLKTDLSGYDFSSLRVWQAHLQRIKLHRVNFAYSDLTKSVFADTFGSIHSVAFSPDGNLLATGSVDGEIRVWQVADGKQLLAYQGHTGWVRSVAFSPDSCMIASGSEDQTVQLWDVQTGQHLKTLQGHTNQVRSVTFSPDGQKLASSSEDQTVRLWDVCTGQGLNIMLSHTDHVRSVTFSPNGDILASCCDDRIVRLWDSHTGQCLNTFQGHISRVGSVAFSPDGNTLASGCDDQTVRLWDARTGQCVKILQGHTKPIWSVAISPDGKRLASGSYDQTVRLWDFDTGQCLNTLQGHSSWVRSVAFSPDGVMIASGSEDQTVRLWDVRTGQRLKTLQGYTNPSWSVTFNPNGDTLVSSNEDNTVRLWDVHTGLCLKILQGHLNRVRSIAFSPNGDILASGCDDQTVRLWDSRIGQCLKTLQKHTDRVRSVAFSPDGNTLASGSEDNTVRLWDVHTGQCLKTLQGHIHAIWSVAFSPNGNTLASGSEDNTVRLWDVHTGLCLKILQGHLNRVRSIAFSPNGDILASCCDDRTVRLWDVPTGQCVKILTEHTHPVWSVAFSPNSNMLASGSEDQTVRLWDVPTGQCLKILHKHTFRVTSVVFSPDSKKLASSSQDQTIRLWDVQTGQCVQTLIADRLYERMNLTGAIGLTEAQKATLNALGAEGI
jgi:WD40 repeat protein